MTTIFQPVGGGHEECPQCKYPHLAAGHQRCISCGWVRGSEIAPPVGRPMMDARTNALAALLPGDTGVSIEQRIQAHQSQTVHPADPLHVQSASLQQAPPPPPPVASIPQPKPVVLPPSPEPAQQKKEAPGKPKFIQ